MKGKLSKKIKALVKYKKRRALNNPRIWIEKQSLRRRLKCHFCGVSLDLAAATVDHKRAKSRGGKDREGNFLIACKRCNGSKGNKDYDQFRSRNIN